MEPAANDGEDSDAALVKAVLRDEKKAKGKEKQSQNTGAGSNSDHYRPAIAAGETDDEEDDDEDDEGSGSDEEEPSAEEDGAGSTRGRVLTKATKKVSHRQAKWEYFCFLAPYAWHAHKSGETKLFIEKAFLVYLDRFPLVPPTSQARRAFKLWLKAVQLINFKRRDDITSVSLITFFSIEEDRARREEHWLGTLRLLRIMLVHPQYEIALRYRTVATAYAAYDGLQSTSADSLPIEPACGESTRSHGLREPSFGEYPLEVLQRVSTGVSTDETLKARSHADGKTLLDQQDLDNRNGEKQEHL
ncbi:hypothetical protein BDN72DRAFT_903991 [Pluteus cervinus]|uniref:Uncharacterized protein n=1 Tax=Pluteus cervinus TaxID=181527 RepID=A0ACD3A7L1_9AGAR|nr:hypothetical protein BDN72DRAFT_903991 [Pluteus cervinus]